MLPVQKLASVTQPSGIDNAYIRGLYQQYQEELCRYLMHKYQLPSGEAEDIVQTAFVRFAALEDPQAVENARAFLYRVVSNVFVDLQRRNQVKNRYSEMNAVEEEASVPGPERVLEGRQRLGILSRALWGMPKKRRQLLLMNRFDGLSYAEIARRVGLSESVVRKHVNRALADCHAALNQSGSLTRSVRATMQEKK